MPLTKQQLADLKRTVTKGNRVGEAIYMLRLTQTEVAHGTGLPQQYVSDVARNRYQTITVDNAQKFADYFGCIIEDLFPAREAVAS
jgi:transcriptional regulator with XRE-family HTH domain